MEVLRLFDKLCLDGVVKAVQAKIVNQGGAEFEMIKVRQFLKDGSEQSLQAAIQIYNTCQSSAVLELIVDYLVSKGLDQASTYLKTLLLSSEGDKQIDVMLRMGYFYLQKQ